MPFPANATVIKFHILTSDDTRAAFALDSEPHSIRQQYGFTPIGQNLLTARRLLDHLLDVERRLGRERVGAQWGPRTIDLDLLLYGDETIDEPGLLVPHPRLTERDFVLRPLAELVPSLKIPGNGTIQEALAGLSSEP